MPQDSLLYAIGRLRMLRRQLLTPAQMQRLIGARDTQEAARVLLEAGYITPEQTDPEKASVARSLKAARMIKRLSPEPAVTDSFLQRFDGLNLKALLKARILNQPAEGLSHAGTLDPEVLRHAVAEHNYKRLPQPLKEAMEALEKRVATQPDPMEIDVLLDKALYGMMHQSLSRSKSPSARQWIEMRADYANLRAFLRMREMDASLTLKDVLLPGGQIPPRAFEDIGAQGEKLMRRYGELYGTDLAVQAMAAMGDRQKIQQLEKRMEQELNSLFARKRMEPDDLDAVIDYLLSVEKESAAVRLIMAGKRNRLTPEQIEERLR